MLETGPLYRKFAYRCRGPVRLPDELNLFCESRKCGGSRVFKLLNDSSLEFGQYCCSNCSLTTYRFLLDWERSHEQEEHSYVSPDGQAADLMNYEVGKVAKTGQDPEPREYISAELAKRLGDVHGRYYRTAIRLRNFKAGIGSLAYLRRVVEDTVNDLLTIVADEARAEGREVDASTIEKAKASRVFDEKMKFAKTWLPARLQPGGHNPLDKLHDLSSIGIHGLSDEECCDQFDGAREVFEYFFEELPRRHLREGAFVKNVSELNKPR